MTWGYEIGRVYNRTNDIHARFSGQQQGGIITPANHSLVIIVTGEEGLEHGYADRMRPDGIFEYFGEGQVGPMQMRAGNRAIAEHSAQGKSLLLFRKHQLAYALKAKWFVRDIISKRRPTGPKPSATRLCLSLEGWTPSPKAWNLPLRRQTRTSKLFENKL